MRKHPVFTGSSTAMAAFKGGAHVTFDVRFVIPDVQPRKNSEKFNFLFPESVYPTANSTYSGVGTSSALSPLHKVYYQ
jgi:hypothetical protein